MTKISLTDKNSNIIQFDVYKNKNGISNENDILKMKRQLLNAINLLPYSDKKLLYLYFFKCLTYKEIAVFEAVATTTIHRKINRILTRIKKIIELEQLDISFLNKNETLIYKNYVINKCSITDLAKRLNCSEALIKQKIKIIKVKLDCQNKRIT